jgi:hypothetical protein
MDDNQKHGISDALYELYSQRQVPILFQMSKRVRSLEDELESLKMEIIELKSEVERLSRIADYS